MANMPDANASPSHPAYFRCGDWNELQDDDPVIMIPYENTLDQSSVLLVSGLVMLISTILLFFAIIKLLLEFVTKSVLIFISSSSLYIFCIQYIISNFISSNIYYIFFIIISIFSGGDSLWIRKIMVL